VRRALVKIAWFAASLVAAIALGNFARVVHRGEPIGSLWLLVAAACIYAVTYRFYAAFLAARVLALDERRLTAAVKLHDGVDYHPTNRWVLLGHHFAAISGAGPIIGPTLAAQFGYAPGFLWLLVGATIGGAVHDMVILTASVRRGGKSLARIVKDELGPWSGVAVALAIIFNVLVAISGSGLAVVNALTRSPWGTFTVVLTIPIAMLMGVYMHSLRPGRVTEVSLIGGALLLGAVLLGSYVPGTFLAPAFTLTRNQLVVGLAVLCFFSSSLPIWLLLLPRDYISAFIKLGTFVLLAAGVVITAPLLHMPAVTRFAGGDGPVVPGKVYPFLFITIACGAISGFHGLIASGTTPKMVKAETDIPMVAFGSMLLESLVAVLALIAACALQPGDYFAINTTLPREAIAALGFAGGSTADLSAAVGTDVAGRPGGSVSLAVGMTRILSSLLGGRSLAPYWYNFCLMFQALFILSLVDAGTRVGRFLIQEVGGFVWKPLAASAGKQLNVMLSSLAVVSIALYLTYTGSVSTIWPMFGVANQILAATALGVGTTLIIKAGRLRYLPVTLVPMLFMAVTSLVAAVELIGIFRDSASRAADAATALTYRIDIGFVVAMAVLGVFIFADMGWKWYGYLGGKRRASTSEIVEYTVPGAPLAGEERA
jgi:carbon starvation protein